MASLTANFKVGSASASSLVKSASTLQTELAAYQDTAAKITYANSAKTDADLQQYIQYLQSRVSSLSGMGRVTDATKALTMQQEITSAIHSNISATIQRENIQVMAGNAKLQDKYNVIVGQYQRAVSIGDDALAQSLMSQAYSVNQTIQYQAQQSATASADLAKKLAAANYANTENYVIGMKQAMETIGKAISTNGVEKSNQVIDAAISELQKAGVQIPKGAKTNVFEIAQNIIGVPTQNKDGTISYNSGSIMDIYQKTAQSIAATDPTSAATVRNNMFGIQAGTTNFNLVAKDSNGNLSSMNYNEIVQAADAERAGQHMYQATVENGQTVFVKNQATGYVWAKDVQGNYYVQDTYAPVGAKLNNQTAASLNAEGFTVVKNDSSGVYVQATSNTAKWFKLSGLQPGEVVQLIPTDSKGSSFVVSSGGNIYQLNFNGGKGQLVEMQQPGADGKSQVKVVGAEAGFKTPMTDQQLVTNAQKQVTGTNGLNPTAVAITKAIGNGIKTGIVDVANVVGDLLKNPEKAISDAVESTPIGKEVVKGAEVVGTAIEHGVSSLFSGVKGILGFSNGGVNQMINTATTQQINYAHEEAIKQQQLLAAAQLQPVNVKPVAQIQAPAPAPIQVKPIQNPLGNLQNTINAQQLQPAASGLKLQSGGSGISLQGGGGTGIRLQ